MHDRTSVSILIPTFNEVSHIDACLEAVLAQTHPLHEVLVLDGGSTDGTRERVSTYGAPVRLVDNPGRGPASALNTGIALSTGEVVCRMDAHTVCEPDYVERCVDVLQETGADVVGGPMRPSGRSPFGRAVAAVTSSPVGMPGRFHFARTRVDVDTVYLGAWLRSSIVHAGGFDAQRFPWWGEDNELNYRIRRDGGRVVLDPSVRSSYAPRETPVDLWVQYLHYGMAKATSVAVHRALPSWRPVAPAALVALSVFGLMTGRGWRSRLLVPVAHASGCMFVGLTLSHAGKCDPIRAAAVQEICHWSFGLGFWAGIGRLLRGRPVQVPLSGHE